MPPLAYRCPKCGRTTRANSLHPLAQNGTWRPGATIKVNCFSPSCGGKAVQHVFVDHSPTTENAR